MYPIKASNYSPKDTNVKYLNLKKFKFYIFWFYIKYLFLNFTKLVGNFSRFNYFFDLILKNMSLDNY